MFFHVSENVIPGAGNRFSDAFQNLSDLSRRCTRARLAEFSQILGVWPLGGSVQGEGEVVETLRSGR